MKIPDHIQGEAFRVARRTQPRQEPYTCEITMDLLAIAEAKYHDKIRERAQYDLTRRLANQLAGRLEYRTRNDEYRYRYCEYIAVKAHVFSDRQLSIFAADVAERVLKSLEESGLSYGHSTSDNSKTNLPQDDIQ